MNKWLNVSTNIRKEIWQQLKSEMEESKEQKRERRETFCSQVEAGRRTGVIFTFPRFQGCKIMSSGIRCKCETGSMQRVERLKKSFN